jgi:hypothetical protein
VALGIWGLVFVVLVGVWWEDRALNIGQAGFLFVEMEMVL